MSVSKRGNSWVVRVRTADKKHLSKSFKYQKDAKQFERELIRSISKGSFIDANKGKITLSQVHEEYIKGKSGLKPKTILSIESLWRVQIEPFLGSMQISRINANTLQKWTTEAVTGPTAFTSQIRIWKAMDEVSRLLDFAVDMGYIEKNVSRKSNGKINRFGFTKPKQKHVPFGLDKDQLNRLAKECGDHATMVYVLGLCGLRWAELVGLQVRDIESDFSRIHVIRTLSETNGTFSEQPTKNYRNRTVDVPPNLQEMLGMYCIGKNSKDLVFPNSLGNPLSSSNFRSRVFNPAIARAGLPKLRIHDLRATCASLMISRGTNIVVVASQLGQDPSITLKHYGYSHAEDQATSARMMNFVFEDEDIDAF